jgi:hypothetical protein
MKSTAVPVDTADGPRHTFHGLPHIRRHVRPERLSEPLDDLTISCEDLIAAREPATRASWSPVASVAGRAVDLLPEDVGVPDVPGVLPDDVHVDPAE